MAGRVDGSDDTDLRPRRPSGLPVSWENEGTFGLRPRPRVGFSQEKRTGTCKGPGWKGCQAPRPGSRDTLNDHVPGPRGQAYHIVVVEKAQSGHALLIPVDSHHGLSGSRQRVLQVRLPGLILITVGKLLEAHRVILQQPHRPETASG